MTVSTDQPRTATDIAPQQEVQLQSEAEPRRINVGWTERKLSLVGGGALLLLGLGRRGLGSLGLATIGGAMLYRGATGHCPLYGTLHLNTAETDQAAPPEEYFSHGIHVETSVTIQRPAQELYRFWRDFENLPKFMRHLEAVKVIDDKHSRWVAKAPAGWSVQWDADIINEEVDTLIAWRSTGNAEVDNAGSVRFVPAPGGRGTEVKVVVDYIPPAGRLGSIIAKMFGEEPAQQINDDLHRFQQLMEAGEIATIKGQPQGTCGASTKTSS